MNDKHTFDIHQAANAAAFVLLLCRSVASAQPSLIIDSVYSQSLNRTKPISIFLPERYDVRQRYPVLYLLHGYAGTHTNWSQRTRLFDYLKDVPLIVVMPDGENSWYVNSPFKPQDRFEDYLVHDIPAYIRQSYSVDTTRQAIAGLSMGGYGAVMIALRHPHQFQFSGDLSGALTFTRELNDTTRPVGRLIAASLRRLARSEAIDLDAFRRTYDIFDLAAQHKGDTSTYYYFAVGVQDSFRDFLPMHRALTDSLRAWKIPYEYHELQGGHTWQFWNREIQPLLRRMRETMKF